MAQTKKKRKKTIKPEINHLDENRQNTTSLFEPVIAILPQDEWVTLDMKLLDWDFMNFEMTLNINANLQSVKNILHAKHGRIKDLIIYKDTVIKEENEMRDDMKSLKEYGLVGGFIKEEAPHFSLCYDFKPKNDCHDPLILSWVR